MNSGRFRVHGICTETFSTVFEPILVCARAYADLPKVPPDDSQR